LCCHRRIQQKETGKAAAFPFELARILPDYAGAAAASPMAAWAMASLADICTQLDAVDEHQGRHRAPAKQ
jgi:hypothetical protein